jgi:uncharacterized protein YcbK (DUF882 family)
MGRTTTPYLIFFVLAPLAGIGASRIEAVATDAPDAGQTEQCRAGDRPRLEIPGRTRLSFPPKKPKYYAPFWRASRRVGLRKLTTTLYNVHQDEAVPILDGQRPPDDVLNHFFRCRGFGNVHPLDPRLLDAVIAAAHRFATARVEVISGYRSPKFNDALSKKGRHVASESKHTKGMAMDVRFVGTAARDVGKWLFNHFEGGVGVYEADDFVHVDTGAKRRWRGR